MKFFKPAPYVSNYFPEEQKVVLSLSLMLLFSVYFALNYLAFTYYPNGMLELRNPGFWLLFANSAFIGGVVLLNKNTIGWSWGDLGLARPNTWWKPILVTVLVFISLVLFSRYLQPYFYQLGEKPDISQLFVLNGNLQLLIFSIIFVWITAAFLEELVFRGFLIPALEIIFGRNRWSTWASLIVSSLIFGLIHAWQGISGILITSCIGFIFGVAYLLNGRRIWPIIAVHGIVDTITLVSIYNM